MYAKEVFAISMRSSRHVRTPPSSLHPLTDDRRILPIDRTGELCRRQTSSCWWRHITPLAIRIFEESQTLDLSTLCRHRIHHPNAEIETQIVMQESGIDIDHAKLSRDCHRLSPFGNTTIWKRALPRLLIYAAKLIVAGLKPSGCFATTLWPTIE